MPWQLCSASVKPAGTIQVSLAVSRTILENSLKFKTEVVLLRYAVKLTNTRKVGMEKSCNTLVRLQRSCSLSYASVK